MEKSLRSWRDSCARGTFLAAEPPREERGEAARELTCLLSRGSFASTIKHAHANLASYA